MVKLLKLRSKLKNKGLSLLEVIITVSILSIGIVVVLQAFSFSARVTGLSCDITKAVFLAKNKIQELEFKESKNQINDSEKDGREDDFQWTYTINLDPNLHLYKLDFEISWQRLNRQEKINLNSYLKNFE